MAGRPQVPQVWLQVHLRLQAPEHAIPLLRVQQALQRQYRDRHGAVQNQLTENWAMAAYPLATRPKGISGIQPRRDLGISQSAVWFLLHRLREARRTLAGPDLAASPVEVDQMYLGGREKNKHADKKGKRNKTAVMGIRDRHAGIVRAMPVPETHRGLSHTVCRVQRRSGSREVHRREPGVRRPEEPPGRKPRRRRVRPGRGVHQLDGVVLGPR